MSEEILLQAFTHGLVSIKRFTEAKEKQEKDKSKKPDKAKELKDSSFVETTLWALVLFLRAFEKRVQRNLQHLPDNRKSPKLQEELVRQHTSLRCLRRLLVDAKKQVHKERITFILKTAHLM